MDAAIGQALWRYAEAGIGHSDALSRLSSRLVRVRAGEYANGRLRSWIRQMNRGGHLRTVILGTEKRKVGSSILPLTTITHLQRRPLTCANAMRGRLLLSGWLRPFTAGGGWLCPIRAQVSRPGVAAVLGGQWSVA